MDYIFKEDGYDKMNLIEALDKVSQVKPWIKEQKDKIRSFYKVPEYYSTWFYYYVEDISDAETYDGVIFSKRQKDSLSRFCKWAVNTALRLYSERI